MPKVVKCSTTHHFPMTNKGNCRRVKGKKYCSAHQMLCSVHPDIAHLKTEDCPACEVILPEAREYVTLKLILELFRAKMMLGIMRHKVLRTKMPKMLNTQTERRHTSLYKILVELRTKQTPPIIAA